MDTIRVCFFHDKVNDIASLKEYWSFLDEDIVSRFEWDEENPQVVFATSKIYLRQDKFDEFRKLYLSDRSRIFILFCDEALEPDLNIYDYALTINCDLHDRDRICCMPPALSYRCQGVNTDNYINKFTYQDALNKIKGDNLKFCNFIYSNPDAHPMRDQLFFKLSEYKRVDSLGPHLNNVNTQGSRATGNWYELSVELKSNYKFSIAAENAVFNGYTSEKLLSSFQAHTVPIYFGNPKVAEEYNPEAFINVNNYADLDALLKKIQEIDEDDELWAKMVSTSWQTDEQIQDYHQKVLNYKSFVKNIFNFNVNIKEKKRLPVGTWATWYANWYMNRDYVLIPIPQKRGLDLKMRQAARKILKILGLLERYDKFKNKSR